MKHLQTYLGTSGVWDTLGVHAADMIWDSSVFEQWVNLGPAGIAAFARDGRTDVVLRDVSLWMNGPASWNSVIDKTAQLRVTYCTSPVDCR
jgi:hypothetical protein